MTPKQQRDKSKLNEQKRELLHNSCEVDIKRSGPHYGLYCNNKKCIKTGQWLGWVKQEQLAKIVF